MKKMNYVRPLAEVVELEAQDIITTSGYTFSHDTAGGDGQAIDGYNIQFDTSTGELKVKQ